MKIDSAVRQFTEKYDRAAMESIEELGNDYTLNITEQKMKLFNIQESFDTFREYLKAYADYKIKNQNNDQASPPDVIRESVKRFINSELFKETDTLYKNVPAFVESYVSGINDVDQTVHDVKTVMTESGIPAEEVGEINNICDQFMDRLNESFDSAMDSILLASGYKSRKRLWAVVKGETKKEKHVFL